MENDLNNTNVEFQEIGSTDFDNVQLAENEFIDNESDNSIRYYEQKRKCLNDTKILKQTWSVQELYQKLSSNKLILKPDYQRNQVWKPDKKTAFIESLFMGILVPPIYVVEVPNDNLLEGNYYEVVDGKQRLSTIKDFLSNQFFLRKKYLEYYADMFGGKYFSDIRKDFEKNIYDMLSSVLDVYVITANSPESIKYDIFSRLNKGAEPLKVNEIRKAIYKSNSLSYLEELVDEYSKQTDYESIFTPNAIKHYDDYGRFYKSISFYLNTNIDQFIVKNYNSRPRDMINLSLSNIQRGIEKISNEEIKEIFLDTINLMKVLKKYEKYEYIVDTLIPFMKNNKEIIMNNIEAFVSDENIKNSLLNSPGTTTNVNNRIKYVKEMLCQLQSKLL